MKIKSKYSLIRLMMIVSMLMLAGFSGYWLTSQYHDEKSLLQETLERSFKLAADEVLDSLLMDVYIKPALGDSLNFTIKLDGPSAMEENDSVLIEKDINHILLQKGASHDSLMPEKVFVRRDSKQAGGTKKIKVIHSSIDSMKSESDFLWNDEEMLVRSFKLVMSETSDNLDTDSIRMIRFDGKENRSMLRDLVKEKLGEADYNFPINWVHNDSIDIKKTEPGKLLISGQTSFTDENAVISGVFPFLLQQILPQFLFVCILLGITCTAFLLMYRTLKKQYELNGMRENLVSNMTHELKTPVSTMKVALEALNVFSVSDDPVKAKEYTEIANQEINRLDLLIARMLDLVTLEGSGRLRNTKSVDLHVLLEDCLQIMKPRIEKKGAKIEFKDPVGQAIITGDPVILEAAILNILDNSLKFSIATPEIIIRITSSKDSIALIVDDNGPGIPSKFSKKIFEKFFRVPTGDVHNVKGHGLGLSFVAQVMHQHGGRIIQKNRPDGGSRFILEFRSNKNGN